MTPSEADLRVAEMLVEVEKTRELKAKKKVHAKVLGRKDLIASVKAHALKETPIEEITGQQNILLGLGLISPDYDMIAGIFQLLESQLAGFYEPEDKHMYLAADLDEDVAKETLAHELVHALQDQYFDLEHSLKFKKSDGDRLGALHSLAEGDALAAGMDVALSGEGKNTLSLDEQTLAAQMRMAIHLQASTVHVPGVLKSSLVAPYADGFLFVQSIRRQGGWRALNDAWLNPPTTTEQLLHPEKWRANEQPMVVPPHSNDLFGGGFQESFSDTMGEQGMRTVFEEWGALRAATLAAAGWGGDRVSVMQRTNQGTEETAVIWTMVFDKDSKGSCGEAEQAFLFMREHAKKHRLVASKQTDTFCRLIGENVPLSASRSNCRITMISGPFTKKNNKLTSSVNCSTSEYESIRLAAP